VKKTVVRVLKDEDTAKRIEEELISAGFDVKRSGREVTQYLLPQKTQREKHERSKHVSKRERNYGYARTEE
jgi:hypothetical protein